MKTVYKVLIGLVVLIIAAVAACFIWYTNSIGPVSSNSKKITFEVPAGSTFQTLATSLKENGLIHSTLSYKLYLKLNKVGALKEGTYELNQNMRLEDIIEVLVKGNNYNPNVVNITFREGLNMRQIADLIEKNTSNKATDVYEVLKDTKYLDELKEKYWFITDAIQGEKIYYPLEGYLFPDTYQFNKDADVKAIFKVMLDKMEKELKEYKTDIEKSKYNVHQLLTLASIIELEAGSSHERSGVAGVFYNRLNSGWTLGSDVTTYYGVKKSFKEELTYDDLRSCNGYNTRGTCVSGLPVGPISNPGRESIKGVMKPTSHSYYYFVADKTGKTYFNTDLAGHNQTIQNLKSAGLWYEYQ